MKLWKVHRDLYRGARLLGDLEAIEKGPTAVATRAEREWLWRLIGRWLVRLSK